MYTNESKPWVLTDNFLLFLFLIQKKNTGSTTRFCNLVSSIEITYMPVAIEPRRLGKHKIYGVIDKNEHFHLESTPCAKFESNYLNFSGKLRTILLFPEDLKEKSNFSRNVII